MTDKEKEQHSQAKTQGAVSVGATLLGAFLGRKAMQAATMAQATTESQSPTPCPFCGAAELKIKNQPGPYTFYFIECPECQARGPVANSEEKAKASWTQRVDLR